MADSDPYFLTTPPENGVSCCTGIGEWCDNSNISNIGVNTSNIGQSMKDSSPPPPTDYKGTSSSKDDEEAKLLAKEMNELSVEERQKVYDDVHGVATARDETPEFVTDCMRKLETSIASLSYAKRKDLDRAFFLRPGLKNSEEFRLMFLRADDYDGQRAAKRMAKYFSNKLALFGEDKLVKDITLDDLSDDEQKALTIINPDNRDRAGRPIWFSDCTKINYDNPTSTLRSCWYEAITSLEDETAQMKGLACVIYLMGEEILAKLPSASRATALILRTGSIYQSLPCRITSFHFGTDDSRMHFFLKGFQTAMGKPIRLRLKSHFGSPQEMKYELRSFGIQCDHFLFIEKNNAQKEGDTPAAASSNKQRQKDFRSYEDFERAYLQTRREVETRREQERLSEEARTGVILYPAPPHDVLLGRGRPNQEFSGNRRFADLVDSQMDRYRNCRGSFEKTCVIMDVVKMVQDAGGRFLRRRSDGWEVVDDTAARKKAGGTFRTRMGLSDAAAAAASGGSGSSDSTPMVIPSSAAAPTARVRRRWKRKYDDEEENGIL